MKFQGDKENSSLSQESMRGLGGFLVCIQGDKMVLFELQGNENAASGTSKPSCSSSDSTCGAEEKSKITLKDKQEMTPQQRRLYKEK